MPFLDKEQKREYQREWARKNKSKRAKKTSNKIIRLPSGKKFDLQSGTITYAELMAGPKIKQIKTFNECVKQAKDILVTRKINRYAIANLALRACDIKKGGHRKMSDEQKNKTLRSFADRVGVNERTLQNWIATKTRIIDRLPEEYVEIDWTAADHASRYTYGEGVEKDPVKAYERFASKKGRSLRRFERYVSYVGFIAQFLKSEPKEIDDSVIKALEIHCRFILKELKNYQ